MKDEQDWIDIYNDFHCKLVEEQREKRVTWLVRTLHLSKDAYYAGTPIMSDVQYDRFESYLYSNEPEHPFLKKVGSKPIMPTPAGFPAP